MRFKLCLVGEYGEVAGEVVRGNGEELIINNALLEFGYDIKSRARG